MSAFPLHALIIFACSEPQLPARHAKDPAQYAPWTNVRTWQPMVPTVCRPEVDFGGPDLPGLFGCTFAQAIIASSFDPSGWKFAAVAKKIVAKFNDAMDSDWAEGRTVIEASGSKIEFLCGCNPAQRRRPEELNF